MASVKHIDGFYSTSLKHIQFSSPGLNKIVVPELIYIYYGCNFSGHCIAIFLFVPYNIGISRVAQSVFVVRVFILL